LSSRASEFSIAHTLVFQKYHHALAYKENTKFGRVLQHFVLYKCLYEVQEQYWILRPDKGNISSTWDKSRYRLPCLLFLALQQFCAQNAVIHLYTFSLSLGIHKAQLFTVKAKMALVIPQRLVPSAGYFRWDFKNCLLM